MSASPAPSHISSDAREPSSLTVTVLAELTVWTRSKPTSGKGKGRESKAPAKRKDFTFNIAKGNDTYVSFARHILSVHSLDKYRVSSRRPFGMKLLVPPDKAYAFLLSLV